MDYDNINCRTDCGMCNHKGAPSAMKGSKLCDSLREGYKPSYESSFIERIIAKIKLKGIMRSKGKRSPLEEETL
jgi:hypothetical protein